MCLNPIPINISDSKVYPRWIRVPCGRCTECQEKYSNEWAFRCVQESSFHAESCFITLTYQDNPVQLIKKDVQDFIKRLRDRIKPVKIRYFACGEYGSKGGRPHYHLMIFGWRPKDLILYKSNYHGDDIYISEFLADTWRGQKNPVTGVYPNSRAGFCSVGEISIKSAKYCAKYMQKFQEVPEGFQKPFILCSTHPGLGALASYVSDLQTDKIYINGQGISIPRYYLKTLEKEGIDLSDLKERRIYMSEMTDSFNLREKKQKRSIDFLSR